MNSVTKNLDGFTVITVQDNGLGIEQKFYDRIFTMFERLHHKEEYSGTGLGLPMCRRIALNHDGDISVQSMIGSGSTFTVQLSNHLS
ncbi:MAG: ATP-binding protein [Granulosicoccus sp.]